MNGKALQQNDMHVPDLRRARSLQHCLRGHGGSPRPETALRPHDVPLLYRDTDGPRIYGTAIIKLQRGMKAFWRNAIAIYYLFSMISNVRSASRQEGGKGIKHPFPSQPEPNFLWICARLIFFFPQYLLFIHEYCQWCSLWNHDVSQTFLPPAHPVK